MDDRTWYLAVATLTVSTVVVMVDAFATSFDVPSGFWTVPTAIVGFLGARSMFKNGKNGGGNGGA